MSKENGHKGFVENGEKRLKLTDVDEETMNSGGQG